MIFSVTALENIRIVEMRSVAATTNVMVLQCMRRDVGDTDGSAGRVRMERTIAASCVSLGDPPSASHGAAGVEVGEGSKRLPNKRLRRGEAKLGAEGSQTYRRCTTHATSRVCGELRRG